MFRSAAPTGASPADAATNANAAVLAHSDVLIARLNATHPALAQRNRRARPRDPSTRWRAERIFRRVWRERPQTLTRDDFSANLPGTYGPGPARSRWLEQARWCTCR